MRRVVIDPCVLVSAFISPKKAAPALLVDAILDGNLDVLVSPALIAELTDVLGREKFAAHAAEGRPAAYIAALRDRATMVEDAAPGPARIADADDDYLIALAQRGMGSMRSCPATGTCWTWHRASFRCSRRGSWPTAWGSRLRADARPSRLPAADLDAVPDEGLTPQ